MSLPVKRVVLYKHGLASFERQGKVDGDVTIDLGFKEKEMNDVLKSLTTVDFSGKGRISSISYDNNKPVSKRLEEDRIKLESGNIFTSLLSQLSGVEVEIKTATGVVSGLVMGCTKLRKGEKEGETYLVSLYNNGSLVSVKLEEILNIEIKDPTLKEDLKSHLAVLRSAKKKDLKKLTIFASGEGERQLSVAYTIEAPIWKVSYRIILPKDADADDKSDEKSEEDGKIQIQGWAIVDNITDESWNNINLTLVAGSPHSYEVDLFTPQYKNRKTAEFDEPSYNAVPRSSRLQARATNRLPQQMMQQQMMPQQMMVSNCLPPQQQMMPQQMMADPFQSTGVSTTDVETKTEELGDLFAYEISNPVTVRSNQSALVPIVSQDAKGSRVLVYNEEKHNKNPNSAVLFTNTTGLTLEKGPITVLEGATYIGESKMENTKPKEHKYLEYSTEQAVEIWSKKSTSSEAYACFIHKGVMTVKSTKTYKTVYHLRNKSAKKHTIYIEHRFRKDCKLVSEPKQTNPIPITFYIFKTFANANDTTLFNVEESTSADQVIYLSSNHSGSTISHWLSKGYINKDIKKKLDEYKSFTSDITALNNSKQRLEREKQDIYKSQERLRNNLRSLGSTKQEISLRERYITDMTKDENQLQNIKTQIVKIEAQIAGLNKKKDAVVGSIEFRNDKLTE